MEITKLKQLHKSAFPDDSETYIDYFFANRYAPNRCFYIEAEGNPISVVHARPMELNVYGKHFVVPFLTGVGTHPDYRYRGLARETLNNCYLYYKNLVPFIVLHPFNVEFYQKLGYIPLNYADKKIAVYNGNNSYTVKEITKADAQLICRLYNLITADTPSVARDEKYTNGLLEEHLLDGDKGYIIYENGIPFGYFLTFGTYIREFFSGKNITPDDLQICDGKGYYDYQNGKLPFSMVKLCSPQLLCRNIRYKCNVNIDISVDGQEFNLTVDNGKIITKKPERQPLVISPEVFLSSFLGHPSEQLPKNLFEALPSYNFIETEKY